MWKLGYRCASNCRHGDEARGASVSRRWPGCRVTRGSRTGRQRMREGLARTVCRRSEQASEYLHMAQNQASTAIHERCRRAALVDRSRSSTGSFLGSFGPARVLGRPRQAVCSSRRWVQGLFRHGRSDGRFVPRAPFGVRQGRRRARGASAGSRREIEDRSLIFEIDMETIRRIFSKKYAGCFGNESFQHPDHIPVHQRRPACRNCVEIAWRPARSRGMTVTATARTAMVGRRQSRGLQPSSPAPDEGGIVEDVQGGCRRCGGEKFFCHAATSSGAASSMSPRCAA